MAPPASGMECVTCALVLKEECVTCAPGPDAGSCADELSNRCGLGRSRKELPACSSEGTRLRLVI